MDGPVDHGADHEEEGEGILAQRFSRRSLLAGAAAAGAGGLVGTMGAQGLSGAATRISAAAKSAAATRSAREAREAAELDASVTSFLKKQFGGGGPHSYAGKAYVYCALLLLSGSQAVYGDEALKGMHLAYKQIAAAGGPKFTVKVTNVLSSDTAAVTGWTSYGESKIPFGQASDDFADGDLIAPAEQYHILTTDAGGGIIRTWYGKPYIWGFRAAFATTGWPGALVYMKHVFPHSTKLAMVGATLGTGAKALYTSVPVNGQGGGFRVDMKKFFPQATTIGYVKSLEVGSTAFTQTYAVSATKLKTLNPDAFFMLMSGDQMQEFAKQWQIAGGTGQMIGPDYFQSGNNLSGSGIEGYWFSSDYFDSGNPGNTWGKLFVESYVKEYGEWPNYYGANYYEGVFYLWQLISRALQKHKDPYTGTVLNGLLEETGTLKSVYGTGTIGSITITKTTHNPSNRPMGLFQVTSESTSTKIFPKQLASYNIGGRTFKVIAKPKKYNGVGLA